MKRQTWKVQAKFLKMQETRRSSCKGVDRLGNQLLSMNDVTSRGVADQAREISVFVNPGYNNLWSNYSSHTTGSHTKPTAAVWPLFHIRKKCTHNIPIERWDTNKITKLHIKQPTKLKS